MDDIINKLLFDINKLTKLINIEIKNKDITLSKDNQNYDSCTFTIDNKIIEYRKGHVTPKKIGHFVSFWKRNNEGNCIPKDREDMFTILIINVTKKEELGNNYFIFPKKVLYENNIISKNNTGGKNGFRIYSPSEKTNNKTSEKTRQWQAFYYYHISDKSNNTDIQNKIMYLINNN